MKEKQKVDLRALDTCEANRKFTEELDAAIATQPEGEVRSALLLQRMVHENYLQWVVLHAEGKNGGGPVMIKALTRFIATMLVESAENLTAPEHRKKLIKLMLEQIIRYSADFADEKNQSGVVVDLTENTVIN